MKNNIVAQRVTFLTTKVLNDRKFRRELEDQFDEFLASPDKKTIELVDKLKVFGRYFKASFSREYKANPLDLAMVIGVITYVVSPIDVIPDFLPLGFMDDLYFARIILNRLTNELKRFEEFETSNTLNDTEESDYVYEINESEILQVFNEVIEEVKDQINNNTIIHGNPENLDFNKRAKYQTKTYEFFNFTEYDYTYVIHMLLLNKFEDEKIISFKEIKNALLFSNNIDDQLIEMIATNLQNYLSKYDEFEDIKINLLLDQKLGKKSFKYNVIDDKFMFFKTYDFFKLDSMENYKYDDHFVRSLKYVKQVDEFDKIVVINIVNLVNKLNNYSENINKKIV